MNGMNAITGKPLNGAEHLKQSVADIIGTPIGSRVMRRDYGSLIPRLIDQPLNQATRLRLFAATAHAIAKWEPRLTVSRVQFSQSEAGRYLLVVEGVDETGGTVTTGIPV